MAHRILAIFLGVAVGMANALCACAQVPAGPSAPAGEPEAPVPACHAPSPGAGAEDVAAGCHPGGALPGQDDHDCCGHCTGTAAADRGQAKVVPPAVVPAPLLFVAADPDSVNRDSQFNRRRFDHTGLSPPAPALTLLSLGCSLLI